MQYTEFCALVQRLVAQIQEPIRNPLSGRGIRFEVRMLVLYGSRAKREHTEQSDWDFYCVVENEGDEYQFLGDTARGPFDELVTTKPPDLIGCSAQVWDSPEPPNAAHSHRWAARTTGVVIWDRDAGVVISAEEYAEVR